MVVIGLAVYAAKRLGFISYINRERRTIFGAVTGWAVWLLCVYSYSVLFDVEIDFWLWATLPPICAFSVFAWLWNFVFVKKSPPQIVENQSYQETETTGKLTQEGAHVKGKGPAFEVSVTSHLWVMFAVGFLFNLALKAVQFGPRLSIIEVSESVGGGLAVLLIGWIFARFWNLRAGWTSVMVFIVLAYFGS